MKKLLIACGALVLLGILTNEFLFTKDCDTCITGAQALAQEGAGFWFFAITIPIVVAVMVYFIFKYVDSQGGVGVSISILVIPLLFLAIAWGKGCTDKADGAVGTKKGRPVPAKIDSTRISAEDLLKQNQK